MNKKIWMIFAAILAILLIVIGSVDYSKAVSSAVMRDCKSLVTKEVQASSLEVLKITSVSNVSDEGRSSATGDLKYAFDKGLLEPYHIGVIVDYRSGSRRATSHCSYSAVLDAKSKKFINVRLESFLNGVDIFTSADVALHAPLKIGFLDKIKSFIPVGVVETNHYIGRNS